jgi:aryl-alcohol dehydrogenase-like predicted oxidoreductase
MRLLFLRKREFPLKQRAIGDLGLSVVGLGGYELGADPAWKGARAVLDAAIDSGINWIDSSEAYFGGMNEQTIAATLKSGMDRVLISTKVAPSPEGTGFRPDQIRKACGKSLKRLDVERLDLFFLHRPDETVPVEESWAAMRSLVDDGLARLVGVSNFKRESIERCMTVGHVDVVQDGLCPIDHLDNRDLFRWCDEQDIAVVTYEPLGNGMLAGAIATPDDFVRVVGEKYKEWGFWKRLFSPGKFERSKAVADGMRLIADRMGCTLAQIALAWNLHQPGVTATLAGSRNPAHVLENAEAGGILLTDNQVAELDALIQLGPLFE